MYTELIPNNNISKNKRSLIRASLSFLIAENFNYYLTKSGFFYMSNFVARELKVRYCYRRAGLDI